jgi:hypothetical protein
MSMMCSMQSCKAKSGACGHEKMMMAVGFVMMAAAAFLLYRRFA